MKKFLLIVSLTILVMTSSFGQEKSIMISNEQKSDLVSKLLKDSDLSKAIVERGVTQTAALWNENDGSLEEFTAFCEANFCKTMAEKEALFNRLADNFEAIWGNNNRTTTKLLRPLHVSGYESTVVDNMFATYDLNAHFNNDMFSNKIAFVITLNFPSFTLAEKNANGNKWTSHEWGFVRLGDVFTSRVNANVLQNISAATAKADHYISNYNIPMGMVSSNKRNQFWSDDIRLISHWGLRDELKSAYSDATTGLEKQRTIYAIMKRIIEQSIPVEVLAESHGEKALWFPCDNTIEITGIELQVTPEKNVRYQRLLDVFNAQRAADEYYSPAMDNYMKRKFDGEFEISIDDAEKLFTTLLQSPQVEQVAKIISKRLGRKLQPFDIWYDGFKNRSTIDAAYLDSLTKAKYPSREALQAGLVDILLDLNFDKAVAEEICKHVHVDASVSAGHAWGALTKDDQSLLRTRISENGLDYKGYNIGVHEFGHNVEQTISLHNVDNYFIAGVPNTAFTEALAFVFQSNDLPLLGVKNTDTQAQHLKTLDLFWGCFEIMGVSLVDIKVWKWMYANPSATADQLKEAYISIAKEVWNQYYAPHFKVKDEPILAIYSHSIDAPLYLSAYPLGHVIEFQLETYLQDKNLGEEVLRIFSIGRLAPNVWMQKAIGENISVDALLKAVTVSAEEIGKNKKKR